MIRFCSKCYLKSSSYEGDLEESADMEVEKNPKSNLLEIKIIYSANNTFHLENESIQSFDTSNPSSAIIQVKGTGPYFDINAIWIRDRKMVEILSAYFKKFKHLTRTSIEANAFYGHVCNVHASSRSNVFKIFSLQEFAFHFFDSLDCKIGIKVFSFESALTGKRKFLVTDVKEFITRYVAIAYGKRHVYEIIRDAFPCRLYFDIEFCVPTNPTIDGDVLCRQWICIVSWKLFEVYGLLVGPEHVVELDSSTTDKFSRHLVFILFADTRTCVDAHVKASRQRSCCLLRSSEGTCCMDLNKDKERVSRNGGSGGAAKEIPVKSAAKSQACSSSSAPSASLLPDTHRRELLFRNNLEMGQFVLAIVRDVLLEVKGTAVAAIAGERSEEEGVVGSTPALSEGNSSGHDTVNSTGDCSDCGDISSGGGDSGSGNTGKRQCVEKESESAQDDCADDSADVVLLPRAYSGWMQLRKRYASMWVWDKERKCRGCFVDLGVYTRNRAFRLLLSSKYGKTMSFKVASASMTARKNRSRVDDVDDAADEGDTLGVGDRMKRVDQNTNYLV